MYAQISRFSSRTHRQGAARADTYVKVIEVLELPREAMGAMVKAENGDVQACEDERQALSRLHITVPTIISPKKQTGDLFAAAAALQIGLGALLVDRSGWHVLTNCFGHGSEQAAFLLEKP